MSIQKKSDVLSISGNEGAKIKQYFHSHNTSNGINYSLAQVTLEPGRKTKRHRISSSEIYYILEGMGDLVVNTNIHHVNKDDSVYIPSNQDQFIKNTGDVILKFLCIVEPEWKAENEIILE